MYKCPMQLNYNLWHVSMQQRCFSLDNDSNLSPYLVMRDQIRKIRLIWHVFEIMCAHVEHDDPDFDVTSTVLLESLPLSKFVEM